MKACYEQMKTLQLFTLLAQLKQKTNKKNTFFLKSAFKPKDPWKCDTLGHWRSPDQTVIAIAKKSDLCYKRLNKNNFDLCPTEGAHVSLKKILQRVQMWKTDVMKYVIRSFIRH